MAFQIIKNVSIKGISACVPSYIEDNKEIPLFQNREESKKFIEATGVEFRHIVGKSGICTSDMCYAGSVKLLEEIGWKSEEIDCLIFVSQTPDFILPATSCILQNRLGLSNDCFSLDISLGCSGWVYGLSVIASLISGGTIKKGLLLAGDTTTVTKSPRDKSTYPLFGDAGTATAVEFNQNASPLLFQFGTDGKGYEAIMIPDGGFRNFVNERSFIDEEIEPGIIRNRLQSILNGPAVFTFGISKAPKSVVSILEHFEIEKEEIDYFIFHQANLFMNEKIRMKLKIDEGKVPYSLRSFGNTSSASIPLTIVTQLKSKLNTDKKLLACAFGVGLSWGSVIFDSITLKCPDLIEIDK
jgi:3-oxoacyl-[acyl-carrier-protein] synthase III